MSKSRRRRPAETANTNHIAIVMRREAAATTWGGVGAQTGVGEQVDLVRRGVDPRHAVAPAEHGVAAEQERDQEDVGTLRLVHNRSNLRMPRHAFSRHGVNTRVGDRDQPGAAWP